MMIGLTVWALVLIAAVLLGTLCERRAWNGGRCGRHGSRWEYFDTDSQGGRGYKCRNPPDDCCVWISYPWVDKEATR